jgi:trehalose synthase-fused probable maltokinase
MTMADDPQALTWQGWSAWLDGPGRHALEHRWLPPFLERQRWFGGKTRRMQSVTIADVAELESSDAAIVLVEVRFGDGGHDLYVLPLSVAFGCERPVPDGMPATAVVAEVSDAGQQGVLHDGVFDSRVRRALLDIVGRGGTISTRHGVLSGHPGARLSAIAGADVATLKDRLGHGEQSNTSIRFGERLMLKVFRRPSEGTNPEREVTEFLTDRVQFDAIAPFGGSIEYLKPGREPVTIAMVQAFVPNEGDAWEWTLGQLRDYFTEVAGRDCPDPSVVERPLVDTWLAGFPPAWARAHVEPSEATAATIGRRTAQLHVALAQATDPAFAPELMDRGDLVRLGAAMAAEGRRSLQALAAHLTRVPDGAQDLAHQVLAQPRLDNVFGALERLPVALRRIRIHGDYHLGQLLRTHDDVVIVDFEGEPARPLAERRAKHPAMKDVAGMLRSFGYAAESARIECAGRAGPRFLREWRRAWEAATGAAFLRAYRTTAGTSGVVPDDQTAFATLLEAYLLDKALYELRYELDNRPTWVAIPLDGIQSLGQ